MVPPRALFDKLKTMTAREVLKAIYDEAELVKYARTEEEELAVLRHLYFKIEDLQFVQGCPGDRSPVGFLSFESVKTETNET